MEPDRDSEGHVGKAGGTGSVASLTFWDDTEVVSPLKGRKRAIDSRQNPFSPQNLEQMIQAGASVTAGYSETGRMHDRADFYSKSFCSCFRHRFDFACGKNLHSGESFAHSGKSRLVL